MCEPQDPPPPSCPPRSARPKGVCPAESLQHSAVTSTSVETRTFAQCYLSLVVIRVTVYTGRRQGVGAGELWLLWGHKGGHGAGMFLLQPLNCALEADVVLSGMRVVGEI